MSKHIPHTCHFAGVKAACIHTHQFTAAQKHSRHICHIAGIEAAYIHARQAAAVIKHPCHIHHITGVKAACIQARQPATAIKHAPHIRHTAGPIPKLVVFYNGTEGREDTVLKLSDAFEVCTPPIEPDIEVKVRMININHGKNKKLMESCKPLAEYAWFVEEIRNNRKNMDIGTAIDKAIETMPEDYLIRPILIGNKAEVKDMCITEYNEAETMQMFREEGREEGIKQGIEQGIERGIEQGADQLGKLISLLISNGRIDDAQKASIDKEVRAALYKEFNIL